MELMQTESIVMATAPSKKTRKAVARSAEHIARQQARLNKQSWRNSPGAWTPEEDEIVMRHAPRVAMRKLPHRTRGAIGVRRWVLGNGKPKSRAIIWSDDEINIMLRRYPTETPANMRKLLPLRSTKQINCKAAHLKLRRIFAGNDDVWITGNMELFDQVRMRAKADGITFKHLDEITGGGDYFTLHGHGRENRSLHLRRIARAVEYFGGKLVIDWCDR
jgi:hypothetical protein